VGGVSQEYTSRGPGPFMMNPRFPAAKVSRKMDAVGGFLTRSLGLSEPRSPPMAAGGLMRSLSPLPSETAKVKRSPPADRPVMIHGPSTEPATAVRLAPSTWPIRWMAWRPRSCAVPISMAPSRPWNNLVAGEMNSRPLPSHFFLILRQASLRVTSVSWQGSHSKGSGRYLRSEGMEKLHLGS